MLESNPVNLELAIPLFAEPAKDFGGGNRTQHVHVHRQLKEWNTPTIMRRTAKTFHQARMNF